MMACDQNRDALAAYLDGELAAGQESELQQHLLGCSTCAAEIASMVRLRRSMKAAGSRFVPSEDFKRKVRAQVAPRRSGFSPMLVFSIAAVALLVAVVSVLWTRQNMLREAAFREVADVHIADLASVNPYDVVSSDRHTVKPWFQGRIPFAFNLPEFAGSEFTLLGGRLTYLHQQPAAQVMVGVRQHRVSVLIVQEASGSSSAFARSGGVEVRDTFNVETWTNHGLRFFVVGDVEKQEIQRLGQLLQNANQ